MIDYYTRIVNKRLFNFKKKLIFLNYEINTSKSARIPSRFRHNFGSNSRASSHQGNEAIKSQLINQAEQSNTWVSPKILRQFKQEINTSKASEIMAKPLDK